MFTSKEFLHHKLGVDAEIARFFVDRKVPDGNLYWKGKYLYVASGTGFLFIPVFVDLQYKSDISREILLDEKHVQLIENILHSAALYEFKTIDFTTHLANCKRLLENRIGSQKLYDDICTYLTEKDLQPYKNLGTASRALNRGDTFLFSLVMLQLPQSIIDELVRRWYLLVPCLLLMDDITDLKDDLEKNEENAVYDFGAGSTGVARAIEFLRGKFYELGEVNPKLAAYLQDALDVKMETLYMKSLLND